MNNCFSAKIYKGKKIITYNGNNIYSPIENIEETKFTEDILENRLDDIVKNKHYYHLHNIDNSIFIASVKYFSETIRADWCNLPLSTLMISSPGEVFKGKTIDYTTDALPIDIKWFDNSKKAYLAESSQFYLELRLLIENVNKVFSIYNSFRKEPADYCHLSEFQHIEFEGKVNNTENATIAKGLLVYLTNYLVENNRLDLKYFLSDSDIKDLKCIFNEDTFKEISLEDALDLLYKDTGEEKYKEFSMKNFGAWEEIRLTEILDGHIVVKDFPLLEIPFYHDELGKNKEGVPTANNADIILSGYREVIGCGQRIRNKDALLEKAKVFNLPIKDYDPYLKMRDYESYETTSGFGMGWQRYVQWLLKLPYIWDSTHVPRGHHLPKP